MVNVDTVEYMWNTWTKSMWKTAFEMFGMCNIHTNRRRIEYMVYMLRLEYRHECRVEYTDCMGREAEYIEYCTNWTVRVLVD